MNEEQREEIDALRAIFEDINVCLDVSDDSGSILIQLRSDFHVCQLTLPTDYPSDSAPVIGSLSPSLLALLQSRASIPNQSSVQREIVKQWDECRPNGVLYSFIEWLLQFIPDETAQIPSGVVDETINYNQRTIECESSGYKIFTSEQPVMDRRSAFIAHLCVLNSVQEIPRIMDQLRREQPRILRATHNIMAYRTDKSLADGRVVLEEDFDDDGETAAGGRLLRLLQLCDCQRVLVVVSRWYGGIQLGPDRFKHINDCARDLLRSRGYVK
jgi:hypothetical protein